MILFVMIRFSRIVNQWTPESADLQALSQFFQFCKFCKFCQKLPFLSSFVHGSIIDSRSQHPWGLRAWWFNLLPLH